MTIERPMFPPRREVETIPPSAIQDTCPAAVVRLDRVRTCRQTISSVTHGGSPAAPVRVVGGPESPATAIDPVFALIETHRKAHQAHLAAIETLNRMERRQGAGAAGWVTEKPCHDENEAFDVLLEAPAVTPSGLLAKLAYLREIAAGQDAWMLDEREGCSLALIGSIAESISTIWGVRS